MQGFSLVELSIVLVILGLLTGGILTGQSLIRAAELRSAITEIQGFQTATMTFRDKYFALPGDMNNAEDFWDTMATGTCPNATAGTGTQTCNGDGNGRIEDSGAGGQSNELYTYWQHLANAGLIEGTYTGIAGSAGPNHGIIGENVPDLKLGNGGSGVQFGNHPNGGTGDFPYSPSHRLWLGAQVASNQVLGALLTPEEAWNIDTKLDDGVPGRGKAMTWRGTINPTCITGDNANPVLAKDSAEYNLTNTSVACAMFFHSVF